MSDITISYKGNSIATMDATGSKTLLTEGKYCEDDITVAYTKPSGGSSAFTLIASAVFENLSEYTDTSTVETIETNINIKNTSYAWGVVVITCDSAITTSNEWGMTVSLFGRYTSNGNICKLNSSMQKGSASLTLSGMVANTVDSGSYGVWINGNSATLSFNRKAHGTACPKVRAGNYTVKVYGLSSL